MKRFPRFSLGVCSLILLLVARSAVLAEAAAIINGDHFVIDSETVTALTPNPKASRLSERLPGHQITLTLETEDGSMQATFKVIARDGKNYLRHELSIHPTNTDLDIRRIILLDLPLRFPTVVGP